MRYRTDNEYFHQIQKWCNAHLVLPILATVLVIGFVILESADSILFPSFNQIHMGTLILLIGLMLSGPAIFVIKKERTRCKTEEIPPLESRKTNTEIKDVFHHLFKSMSEGIALYRSVFNSEGALVNFQLMDINEAWIHHMDEDPTDQIGTFLTELDGFFEPAHLGIFRCVASTGESQVFRQYRASIRKHVRIVVTSVYEGWIATKVEVLPSVEEEFPPSLSRGQWGESVDVLAGGMAHSINNLLTSILGNTQFALQSLAPDSPVNPMLEEISSASLRVADLCNKLLQYAGINQFQMESLSLDILVRELHHELRNIVSPSVSLHYTLADSLPFLAADREELRQVIIGLVANASEAIGNQSGNIVITTGVMMCKRRYLDGTWLGKEAREGEYIYLEVNDTGSGMQHNTLKRIFEPFYSTKFMGRGLGLAATLGIVRAHQGAIKVHSQIGKGTSIRILLPRSEVPPKQLESQSFSRK